MEKSILCKKADWLIGRYIRRAQSGVHRMIAVREEGELVGLRMDAYEFPSYEDRECFGDVLVVYQEEPAPFLANNPDLLDSVTFYRDVDELPEEFLLLIIDELERKQGKAPSIC